MAIALSGLCMALTASASQTYPLTELGVSATQDWGSLGLNKSVDGHSLSIGGKPFATGLGTHANSEIEIDLGGTGEWFEAMAGVDDEKNGRGTVVFKVTDGDRVLWESGLRRGGQPAVPVRVDLRGVKKLVLIVDDGGDGLDSDHADWAEARIVMASGKPVPAQAPVEPVVILTPKPAPQPRINGAMRFGVRPGAPLLYTIAASGERPMTFEAAGLPAGAALDPATGRITGVVTNAGEYSVVLRAVNARGKAERTLKIVCGPVIGLTPAMGWNSWNCFAGAVTAERVRAAADAMVSSGLIQHGWNYINIDDFWQVHRDSKDPTLQGPGRDAQGWILPNPRFPDMKGLADYVHAKGLRAGLYSSPGPWTCGGCVGSWQHEEQDAKSYGDWGFDYLKYDWCSYGNVISGNWNNYTREALQKPYRVMRAALDKVPRDILFSFCQYGAGDVWEWGAETGGNSWRTTGDIVDTWGSMSTIGFGQSGHEKYAGPGHFNDPDMLVVGKVGWGPQLHPTRLTANEQYTHISLWCLLAAPLLIGCDMTQMDDFTLSLLTNDEVLDVNQDSLGRQAGRVTVSGRTEVWAKELEDGSRAVGLFNRGPAETVVKVRWSDLGLKGPQRVRDLWRQKDVGTFDEAFSASVPRHGVVLVKVNGK
ncbi:MAG: NPCBM/NEW2 domain-containing protein [Verrucomicrobiota bacterium]